MRKIVDGMLYTSARPGREAGRGVIPKPGHVDEWIDMASRGGIRSVVCLLDDRPQLHHYYDRLDLHPWGLLGYYRERGLEVCYFRAVDNRPVPHRVKMGAWEAFQRLRKPVVFQDSGGVDRVGAVATFIRERIAQRVVE